MKHGILWTVVVVLILVGSFGLIVYSLNTQHKQDERQATALTALCTLRGDLDQRITSARDFLAAHPHGIPGISAGAIRVSIANSERTRRALSILDCKESP